mmetsp:Transcript_8938/g.28408  ORF Transcript_8938/g.28408 Transcript_8938/m.28408 type:complete len:112 (-) Transcript_8938:1133-1468(-)
MSNAAEIQTAPLAAVTMGSWYQHTKEDGGRKEGKRSKDNDNDDTPVQESMHRQLGQLPSSKSVDSVPGITLEPEPRERKPITHDIGIKSEATTPSGQGKSSDVPQTEACKG